MNEMRLFNLATGNAMTSEYKNAALALEVAASNLQMQLEEMLQEIAGATQAFSEPLSGAVLDGFYREAVNVLRERGQKHPRMVEYGSERADAAMARIEDVVSDPERRLIAILAMLVEATNQAMELYAEIEKEEA